MTASCSQGDDDAACYDSQPFDFGIRLGLVFIVETASFSAIAVLGLLTYIGYSFAKIKANASRKWSTATHVHWYFLSMLVSELIQAIGGIINVRWILNARVIEGSVCTTQGVLKQCGDVGVALASLAIAVHTFCALVFRWIPPQSSRIPFIVLAGIWIFLVLLVSLSLGTHKHDDYYGNTEFWCWITSAYPVQRIVLEYMWLWITCFLNFILYIPMALVIIYDGMVVVHNWRIRLVRNVAQRSDKRGERKLAIKMLGYPLVYTITVLPIAITRWMEFSGRNIPWAGTVFSDVVFASSGILNVLLFTATRPNLLPRRANSILSQPPTSPRSTRIQHSRDTTADGDRAESAELLDVSSPLTPPPSTALDGAWKLNTLKRPQGNRHIKGTLCGWKITPNVSNLASIPDLEKQALLVRYFKVLTIISASASEIKRLVLYHSHDRDVHDRHRSPRVPVFLLIHIIVFISREMGGNQSVPKITKQDRAILDLKLQRDKVKQYRKKIQAVLDREHEIAKEQLSVGHKDRALLALRRRRYQESLLAKTDSQLENLENLVSTIEFSLVEVSVMHGLQQGNEVLKEIHKEMNIESVEKILEETAEAREYQRASLPSLCCFSMLIHALQEIDEMLGNTLTAEDEEAVQAELLELQKEVVGEEEPAKPLMLPSVPTTEPEVSTMQEEEEAMEGRERVPVPG
ncbi:hypothetical protein NM688_g4374 [Phlebia brevispora]|uniref:Uncharacterized protein n=1 Tax=Phlebia brevispora TaxID=194682 RepID=A0ACC1T323_9APHY|nr:hypothetical protein NM688_g4374 [Phlebia brevispora]